TQQGSRSLNSASAGNGWSCSKKSHLVTRAAVIRDPSQFSGVGMLAAIQAIAPSLRVELSAIDARDTGEIERALTNFSGQPNGGVIVTASAAADHHRALIPTLAKRHRLPTVHAPRN